MRRSHRRRHQSCRCARHARCGVCFFCGSTVAASLTCSATGTTGLTGGWPALARLGRCTGEARFIFNEIAVEQCYGDPVSLAPGVVVYARVNLGIFSLYVARTWRGSGSLVVLGFELAAEAYALAVRNLREHGVLLVEDGDRPMSGDMAPPAPGVVVHCFRVALGGTDGQDELRYLPYLSSNSTLVQYRHEKERHRRAGCFGSRLVDILFAGERRETVRSTRLSTVLAAFDRASGCEAPVSLLKCDVKGAEGAVFRGVGDELWRRLKRFAVKGHSQDVLLLETIKHKHNTSTTTLCRRRDAR